MKLKQIRPNVFEVTLTSQELSALFASTRMTRDAMANDINAPRELVRLLDQLLADYDRLTDTSRDQT
jgi:hypothetical protein